MGNRGISFSGNYLEYLPLNKIARYSEGYAKKAHPFIGYPQQHPTDKAKLILVYDPLGGNSLGESPAVLEFKLDDILHVEEVPQVVNEKGEGIPLVKLWIRRGAHGMLLEPFEVDGTLNFLEIRREQKEKFSKQEAPASAGESEPKGSSPARPGRR